MVEEEEKWHEWNSAVQWITDTSVCPILLKADIEAITINRLPSALAIDSYKNVLVCDDTRTMQREIDEQTP